MTSSQSRRRSNERRVIITDAIAFNHNEEEESPIFVVDDDEEENKSNNNKSSSSTTKRKRSTSWSYSSIGVVVISISFMMILLMQYVYNSSSSNSNFVDENSSRRNSLSSSSSSLSNIRNNNSNNQRIGRRKNQEIIFNFEYLTSEDIFRRIHDWKNQFPDFVDVTSSQELYGLETAGTPYDCPFEEDTPGCSNWIVTIHDKNQNLNTTMKHTPEVFLSGALHGDEWIGPTTVIETAQLLLEAASCESLPQGHTVNGQPVENWDEQINEAKNCRAQLAERGIYPVHRKWLARLVSTRQIIILPTANSLGYYRGVREENGIDPNRDFPYDLENEIEDHQEEEGDNEGRRNTKSKPKCLQSIAAQTIYSLFNDHAIQLGVTYHGGMEAIAYEWGAPSHMNDMSPDEISQKQISQMFSSYAGTSYGNSNDDDSVNEDSNNKKNNKNTYYPIGSMNELVYPVNGGMEDWAYAASWDTKLVSNQCSSTTIPPQQQQSKPNPISTRMFMSLVETSNNKKPSVTKLGTNQDMFSPTGFGNGYVSRNIRLALSMIDIVEPYVSILAVNNEELWDDIVPLSPRNSYSSSKKSSTINENSNHTNSEENDNNNNVEIDIDVNDNDMDMSCRKTKIISVPYGTEFVTISWTIGGSFTVDSTSLWYGNWNDLQSSEHDGNPSPFNCMEIQPTREEINNYLKSHAEPILQTVPVYGKTRWHDETEFPKPGKDEALHPLDSIYSAKVDLRTFNQGDSIAVYSVARVDQEWSNKPTSNDNKNSKLSPQTHLVNVRTDPDWNYELRRNDEEEVQQIIQGRLDWFSIPLTIEIGPSKSTMHEKSVRHPKDQWIDNDGGGGDGSSRSSSFSSSTDNDVDIQVIYKAAFAAMLVALVIWTCFICRDESNGNEICQIWKERRLALQPLDNTDYDEVTIYDLQHQQQQQQQQKGHDGGSDDIEIDLT